VGPICSITAGPFCLDITTLLKNDVMLVGLGALAGFSPAIPGNTDASAQIKTKPNKEERKGSTVILFGTQGGPGISLTRGETASALVVDGHIYLIDCGYGTLRALTQAGLSYNDLSAVFLTPLHNDHTADVAALLSHMLTGSRTKPAAVYGPFGTAALVAGSIAFARP